MRLCACPRPTRDTTQPDRRLHCTHCGGATPYGQPHNRTRLQLACQEAHSLLTKIQEDLSWELAPAGADNPPTRTTQPSNPTQRSAIDTRTTHIRAYAVLAARRLERALAELRLADEATGAMCLAAETRPPTHVKAPWHDSIPEGRPDLEESHAAKARRRARGDGYGAA